MMAREPSTLEDAERIVCSSFFDDERCIRLDEKGAATDPFPRKVNTLTRASDGL